MSDMVPEADAIEQSQDVERASEDDPAEGVGAAARSAAAQGAANGGMPSSFGSDAEVPEADALEQAADVRDSDDDLPRDG